MRENHLKTELAFYKKAFKNNFKRREQKYGWEFKPSKSIVEIVKRNGLARKATGKRVLDAGCGDGRHIEYFRRLGFEVWGIDFSKEAIALCQDRFAKDNKVHLEVADLTEKKILSGLGKFDIVLDWSVFDHIRKPYVADYMQNLTGVIIDGGYGIFSEFNAPLPGRFKGKNYKVVGGHYSRSYTAPQLKRVLKRLKAVDQIINADENDVNNYRFNTLLMKKI